jgi:hypothetical protein
LGIKGFYLLTGISFSHILAHIFYWPMPFHNFDFNFYLDLVYLDQEKYFSSIQFSSIFTGIFSCFGKREKKTDIELQAKKSTYKGFRRKSESDVIVIGRKSFNVDKDDSLKQVNSFENKSECDSVYTTIDKGKGKETNFIKDLENSTTKPKESLNFSNSNRNSISTPRESLDFPSNYSAASSYIPKLTPNFYSHSVKSSTSTGCISEVYNTKAPTPPNSSTNSWVEVDKPKGHFSFVHVDKPVSRPPSNTSEYEIPNSSISKRALG